LLSHLTRNSKEKTHLTKTAITMAPTPQAQSIVIDVIEYLTDAIIDTDDIYTRLETWRTLQVRTFCRIKVLASSFE
jgi:hypothetical protein